MQLTTERLIVREFIADDWPAVLAYQSDPRYQSFYPQTDLEQEWQDQQQL